MKKWILTIIGIVLIGIVGIGIKINSDFDKVVEAFHCEHSLKDASFVLISESISPNKKHKYYEYQFDNGGFGYSRVFWSVLENNENKSDLEKGLIPDGYKIVGWTKENELILEKWEPYYEINKTELKNGTEVNGVKIAFAKLNVQIQFPGYPTSDKVEFNIKAEKKYYAGKPIEIKLIWKNKSNSNEKIMIRDYWEHPIGTGASIMDLNNVELTSQISSHILSSQLFSPDDLKEYEIELKPNETKEYSVDLLKIPILKQTESNPKSTLPKGKYKIQVFYYSKMSKEIEIEIK
ncbi:MAG: hypothetical protein HRT63_10990 [Erythrobacter sp.]|nr:hypothetical protein [Erythrobacter sp.]